MMGDEALRNRRQQLSPERLERAREAIVFLSSLPINTSSSLNASSSTGQINSSSSSRSRSELLSRCDQAISRLQASRQSISTKRQASVREELLCTLRGGSRNKTRTKKRKCAWKHKFVCLAYKDQQVPIREAEKDELFAAGLGEKEIEFDDLCASAEDFRDILYQAFPQLQDGGGYQLLKCIPNSRQLESLSGLVMQSPLKLKQRVGTARTYIRPLQKNLDTTPIEQKDGSVKEKCLSCGQLFPTCDLPEHLSACNECTSPNDSDDEFSELPPWRQGANEGGGWTDGLRRSIDELRSRAVIPSSELRQPSDDTGQPSDNPRSSDNARSSVDPRRSSVDPRRSSVDPRRPSTDDPRRPSVDDPRRLSDNLRRPNDDERRPRVDPGRSSDNPRRPSDDQRRQSDDQRAEWMPSDDQRRLSDDQRSPSIDPRVPSNDQRRPTIDSRRQCDDSRGPSDELRMVDLTKDEYETEQHMLQEVVNISTMNVYSPDAPPFSPLTPGSPEAIDLNSLLNQLQLSLAGSFTIEIRRSHLLCDALKEARKKKFDPMKNLRVSFVGEGAIDEGGPKREFFRLLIQEIGQSEYMQGGTQKFFLANVPAILRGDFKLIGYYAGMSSVQGGPGFPLLTDSMFHYMSTGEVASVQTEDDNLPLQIKSLVNQVNEATTNEELRTVFSDVENENLLLETGYRQAIPHLDISERSNLLSVILDYHCMLKAKAANDQFLEGLQVTKVLDCIRKFPDIMKSLFCYKKSMLTADYLKSLFHIVFCDPEDPNRAKQEAAYVYLMDFLDECEAGDGTCNLDEVLIFCTGSDCVPPVGFHKKIDVIFLESEEILPTASTCSLEFRIPICHKDSSTFNEKMELALKCGMEFGCA